MTHEEKKLLHKVSKDCGRTLFNYNLLNNGSRVLAGISGGKDSLTMVDLLAEKRKVIPISFELHAAYVHIEGIPHTTDTDALRRFCEARDVTFHLLHTEVDLTEARQKDLCYFCSLYRRNAMFSFCRDHGFDRLALGHTLDDLASTILMNMAWHANISTMPVSMPLFKGKLTIIRPLAETAESDIIEYCRIRELAVQHQPCPLGAGTNRKQMKDLIASLQETNPRARMNIFRSMRNIKSDYLS